MEWTKAQREVIETRGKNILVSAAAGSGKTAVLIERITQLIIKDRVDIDRFLITTFTNAASLEMKSRLEKAVREELKKPGADREFLKKQLSLMPGANISTFHTFALEVMKRYFYFTDLEPGFRIGDETEISIMKEAAVNELFELRFDEDYDVFTAFLRKYSNDRNENRIKKNITALYDEMRSIPDYMDWADKRTSLLDTKFPSEALGLLDIIAEETEAELKKAYTCYSEAADMLEEAGIEGLERKAREDSLTISDILETAAKESDVRQRLLIYGELLKDIRFNQMRVSKDQQESYEEIKERVSSLRKRGRKFLDDIRKRYYQRTFEEYDMELNRVYDDTKYMVGLIREFEYIFRQKKAEKNMVDFDDVMHYAIEILRNDMASAEYREKFMYIFIDEFQDSNMLQEAIIERIAGNDNLFMVGDVKQSIYKFRLAEPEIFKRKYLKYSRECEKNSIKIDLNSNFRSKKSVTDTVNRVFMSVMEGYDEDAMLKCTVDEKHGGIGTQCHIISSAGMNEAGGESVRPEEELILRLIRSSIGQEIYDVKTGTLRKIGYRDIVILSRSRSAVATLERFLNNEGIPAYGEDSGGYFETVEIQVFVNILRIIDNTMQDIPLISSMRSPVFGFGVRELAEIRMEHREGSFYSAVKSYMENGRDSRLKEKLREMHKQLQTWKTLKNTVTLEELVRTLLYDTGYYDYCSGLPVGRQRISNLRLLVEKAGQFEQHDYSGIYGFLSYIEAMKRSNITVSEAKTLGENDDVVRVMTVHKSKGLEFPVVILAGMGRMIKYRGSGNTAVMHKDLAVGLPFVNYHERWHRKTILQRVAESLKAKEEYEEEIRILYVAMTRAMDSLILLGTVKDEEKLDEASGRAGSFLEMAYPAVKEYNGDIHIYRNIGDISSRREQGCMEGITDISEKEYSGLEYKAEEIDRRLSFVYPMEEAANVRSKYSATQLNRMRNMRGDQDTVILKELPKPEFISREKKSDPARIGTLMHLVMEKLDFGKALNGGDEYIERFVEKLCSDGTVSDEEKSMINTKNITAFFSKEPGWRAAQANMICKEREFILSEKIGEEDVIVQGIIDCYFEEDDGIVLIDYKNVYAKNEQEENRLTEEYGMQIEIYREALEKSSGKKVKEAYLYLFGSQQFIPVKLRN